MNQWYDLEHEVIIHAAACLPGQSPRTERIQLGNPPDANLNPESKLVILPKKRAECNSGMLVRFGWAENESGQPPLIILGMHRSGKSILARLLEKLGLFAGYCRESNNKPTFSYG